MDLNTPESNIWQVNLENMVRYYRAVNGDICFNIMFQDLNITNSANPHAADAVMDFMKAEWDAYMKEMEEEIRYAVEGFCRGAGYFIHSEYRTEETEGYLNIIQYISTYFGGVHSERMRFAYVFDSEGKNIKFRELVKDEQKAKAAIIEELRKQIRKLDIQGYIFTGLDYDKVLQRLLSDEARSWYLKEEGLDFYVPAYMIAPGAAGDFEFFVPYNWKMADKI